MLVSPTEPKSLHSLGKVSLKPERFGADFLIASPLGLIGVQRKEIDDLVASIQVGGRLQEQLAKMNQLSIKVVLLEGVVSWTTDGMLNGRSKWTRSQHFGSIWSMQLQGCWIGQTPSLQESGTFLSMLERWALRRSNHDGLRRRPKTQSQWGSRDNRDWAVGLLSQIDGVGLDRAEKIYDKVGMPLIWDPRIEWSEVLEIDGIGVKTVSKIMGCLGGDNGSVHTVPSP